MSGHIRYRRELVPEESLGLRGRSKMGRTQGVADFRSDAIIQAGLEFEIDHVLC